MIRNTFLLFSLLFYLNFLGIAQDNKAVFLVSPDGDTTFINPIPDTEITNTIESTYSKIKSIEVNLEPDTELDKFDSIYKHAHIELDSLKKVILTTREFNSVSDIDNVLQEWNTYSQNLNKWSDKINERIKTLQDDYFQISVATDVWNATLKKSKSSGVPRDVLSSTEELYRTLKVLKETIKDNQNEALRKQNRITELRLIVDEVNTYLSKTRKSIQSDYFVKDRPAIWNSADSTANFNLIKKQFTKSTEDNLNSLQLFYRTNKNGLIFQLILFIILWIGFYYLHRQSINENEIDDELKLESARGIISEHGITALVLALFASIWIYQANITPIDIIIQFLYITIALFFIPRHIDKRLRIILFGLLFLFLTSNIQVLFSGKILFTRLALLLENVISIWIIYTIASPKIFIRSILKEKNWGIVLKLIPVFYFLIVVSAIANILGYVNLALLLNNATVNTLFNLNIVILVIMVLRHTIYILLRTTFLQNSNIIRQNHHLIERRSFAIVQIIAVFLWIKSILRNLGLLEGLNTWLTDIMEANWKIGESEISVQGIVNFILVIIVTLIFNRIIKSLLKDELYPRVKLARGIPGAISMITGYIIAGYGIFIALGSAGVDLKSFGLVAGALGVGIGFGLQGIVANFIAGLVIAFERPIQVGDTIEIGTMMGDVTKIGVRACTVKTFDGSEVIIPNSSLITNDVTNWTLSDRRKRRDINIGVAYGTNPQQVLDLITEVANKHPEVLKIPAPWALFDGFGDNSLNFRVRIWTTMDNGMTTQSSVTVSIYDALQDAGIEIPFPQRDLHLRSIDPSIQGIKDVSRKPARKNKMTTKNKSDKSKPERNFEDDPDISNGNDFDI